MAEGIIIPSIGPGRVLKIQIEEEVYDWTELSAACKLWVVLFFLESNNIIDLGISSVLFASALILLIGIFLLLTYIHIWVIYNMFWYCFPLKQNEEQINVRSTYITFICVFALMEFILYNQFTTYYFFLFYSLLTFLLLSFLNFCWKKCYRNYFSHL